MTEADYKKELLTKTPEQLVEEIVRLTKSRYTLTNKFKDLLNRKEETIMELNKQLENTRKIGEYYEKKERPHRRKDIDDEVLKDLYVTKGLTVYRIAKDTGWTDMTIRNRLKAMGIYEGKIRSKGVKK